MVVSSDCKRLFVAFGNIIILYVSTTTTSAGGTRQGKSRFLESAKFLFHADTISSISLFADRFLVSAAQDSYATLWPAGNTEAPICSCFFSSKIYSCGLLVDLSGVDQGVGSWEETGSVTSIAAFGTSSGYVTQSHCSGKSHYGFTCLGRSGCFRCQTRDLPLPSCYFRVQIKLYSLFK